MLQEIHINKDNDLIELNDEILESFLNGASKIFLPIDVKKG